MDISCWSIWCTYVVCTASVFCSEWKETWCGNFCYLFMFWWQLHIKAKCKVKLAYTAVLIMLPLPVQTFYPLARVRQPPNSKFYSLSPPFFFHVFHQEQYRLQRETKTSVNWITLFSDPSTFRLSLLSLASAAAVCVLMPLKDFPKFSLTQQI